MGERDASNVVPLVAAQGSLLATISFWRQPDGTIRAALDDMPKHVIETQETITERFVLASEWCVSGAADFLRQAVIFDVNTQEPTS